MGFKLVRVDATEPCKIPLPVGTHLIGRGKFLDCNDHRVSRMHGKLNVTDDAVTITALHQNPCFFRKKGVTTIHVLPHNKCIDLTNGDQFGLIPDSFWFEVIYCIENVQGPGTIMTPFTRAVKENTQPSGSGSSGDGSQVSGGRDRANRPSMLQDTTTMDSQDTITSDQDQYPSPSKRTHPDTQPYNAKKPKTEPLSPTIEQLRPNETTSPSLLNESSENHQNVSENDQNVSQNDQNVSQNDQNPSENDQNPSENDQNPSENDQNQSENDQNPSDNDQNPSENNQNLSESKQSLNNNDQITQTPSHNDQNSSEDVKPSPDIIPKKEPSNGESSEINSNENKPPANVKQEPSSPENVKPGPSHEQQINQRPAADGAGAALGAAQGNNGRPREKCMYGEKCYRVNPVHKAQFSHPGDADWGLERVCPRGAACRDHRPAHWRDNTHPANANPRRDNDRPGKRRRPRKVSKSSDSEATSDNGDDPSALIVTGPRKRKTIIREQWSDSENEDPFGTDEEDEWEPLKDN